MDKLRPQQIPVCTHCDGALKIIQTIAASGGGLIIIYQCSSCQRLHWQEPEQRDEHSS